MRNWTSRPSMRRRALTAGLLGAMLAFVMACKLLRGGEYSPIPAWLAGSWPSLAAAFCLPLALFFSSRVVTLGDYLQFAAVATVALLGYEFAQHLMPRRTFSWEDVGATLLGGGVALGLGLPYFRHGAVPPGQAAT